MSTSRLLIVALAACLTITVTAAAAQRDRDRDATLARQGLSISLPAGWHGVIYRRTGGLPVIHAGNFRLRKGDDDPGSLAIRKMGRASIFMVLLESAGTRGFNWRSLQRPPQVRPNDFLKLFKGVPPSHAFARVLFRTHHRYFQLWLQFGVRPAPAQRLNEANRVLRTLVIRPR